MNPTMADGPTVAQMLSLLESNANQLTTLTAAVTDLTSQVAASTSNGAPSAVSASASSPPSFALAPGLVQPGALLDYSTKYGDSQWKQGTSPLSTLVDLKSGVTEVFRSELAQRAASQGWDDLFKLRGTAGTEINLLNSYRQISLKEVQDQTKDLVGTGAAVETRKAQNNAQACQCLLGSLTVSAKALLLTHSTDFSVTEANTAGDQQVFMVAARMYKVMMNIITVDSRATEKQLRGKMCALPEAMVQCNYDIALF